jgi:hypothetical protein
MKVTVFSKFRRLQWARHVIRMEEYRTTKKAAQQTHHTKRRLRKPRKRWEDVVGEDAILLLCTQAGKTKAKDTEPWRHHTAEAKALFGL